MPAQIIRRKAITFIIVVSALIGTYYVTDQWLESRYVRLTTERVLRGVPADRRSRVIAIRDYLRGHVTYIGAPLYKRPFFRASAAETLKSGKGFCGEVSRTFICMAGVAGIPAERINLYGTRQHVVAEAELAPNDAVIVDCQNPPYIRELARLDDVIRSPMFDDYYTLNLRRLHVSWLVTRLRLHMGPLTYWSENPAALKAILFYSIAAFLLFLRGFRAGFRRYVRSRGWIHTSDLQLKHSQFHNPQR